MLSSVNVPVLVFFMNPRLHSRFSGQRWQGIFHPAPTVAQHESRVHLTPLNTFLHDFSSIVVKHTPIRVSIWKKKGYVFRLYVVKLKVFCTKGYVHTHVCLCEKVICLQVRCTQFVHRGVCTKKTTRVLVWESDTFFRLNVLLWKTKEILCTVIFSKIMVIIRRFIQVFKVVKCDLKHNICIIK